MLSYLKMEFQGREHSGLDDARNLAAIGKRMHQEGCVLETNCKYDKNKHVPYREHPRRMRKR